jgi:hypothetical protein
MAVRFSDEIFGTQFHPEADPLGFIKNLEDEKNKEAMIETFGMEKYLETIDRMDDDDKIVLTRAQIIPRFLQLASEQITKNLVFGNKTQTTKVTKLLTKIIFKSSKSLSFNLFFFYLKINILTL